MAKIFTKLNVGDTVATSGTRVFKKLTTEPTKDLHGWDGADLRGTEWEVSSFTAEAGYGEFDIYGETAAVQESGLNVYFPWRSLFVGYNRYNSSGESFITARENTLFFYSWGLPASIASGNSARLFDVVGGSDVSNPRLIAWMLENANLIKYEPIGEDGLFDNDGKLIASWKELSHAHGYQMYAADNYTESDYATDTHSPHYLLTNTTELSKGNKLITGGKLYKIGDYAFADCETLKSVIIGDSVTSIGGASFNECFHLESVTIGNGVKTIGDFAFNDCENLTDVTIGNSVETIGKSAFMICVRLEEIVIPASVKSIGDYAFHYTTLTDVYYRGTEQEWAAITIGANNDPLRNATIHYNYTD